MLFWVMKEIGKAIEEAQARGDYCWSGSVIDGWLRWDSFGHDGEKIPSEQARIRNVSQAFRLTLKLS